MVQSSDSIFLFLTDRATFMIISEGVVQLMTVIEPSTAIERELIDFCHEHLARQKCPRSIDCEVELPRLPTGKLYKRPLRDRYWGDKKSRIV